MNLIDQIGRKIVLDIPAKRIVSLVPSITETLFDLGLASHVVGRTKFCTEPKDAVRSAIVVGGTKQFHPDRIEALQPDLIVANKEENDKEMVAAIAGRFPVWVSDIKNIADAVHMIETMGLITNTSHVANLITSQIQTDFVALDPPTLTVAYFIWQSPFMVAGGDTFINEMLLHCGLKNVFADCPRYPQVSAEELADRSPDLIFLSSEPFPYAEKHLDSYRGIVPEARVHLVDGTYFSWYGTRLARAKAYFSAAAREWIAN